MGVIFYVPNLIGYLRIALLLWAFVAENIEKELFLSLYAFSFLLDAVDGWAARYFSQSSTYGAVLDMITDRAATLALVMALLKIHPTFSLAFTALATLDLTSHYTRMYVSFSERVTSHKSVKKSSSALLRIYYTSRIVMGALCVGQEAFYLWLYYSQDTITLISQIVSSWALGAIFVLFALKQCVNFLQLCEGMVSLSKRKK